MEALRKGMIFLGVLIVITLTTVSAGHLDFKEFSEPLTLLLVIGLTLFLGAMTYAPGAIAAEMKKLLTHSKGGEGPDRRLLAQLALYALVSGVVLAIVQIMLKLRAEPGGQLGWEVTRTALLSLLYGVLAGVGFWAASGLDRPDKSCADSPDFNRQRPATAVQTTLAFCVLLLIVGVLAVCLVGMRMGPEKCGRFMGRAEAATMPISQKIELDDRQLWLPAAWVDVPVDSEDTTPVINTEKGENAPSVENNPRISTRWEQGRPVVQWPQGKSLPAIKQDR